MRNLSALVLLLMLLTSSLIILESASAQSIPKPSVPEFTVELVDHSYDVLAKNGSKTDPYTNKTTTYIIPGHHVRNITIDVTISNQIFPTIINGNRTNLYYDIQTKPHFNDQWTSRYIYPDSHIYSNAQTLPVQSDSKYTVISLQDNYEVGGQVDFQVEALLGYEYTHYLPDHMIAIPETDFIYRESGWSPTQIFTMPNLNTTPTPTVPELSSLAILPLALFILSIVAIVRHRKPSLSRLD